MKKLLLTAAACWCIGCQGEPAVQTPSESSPATTTTAESAAAEAEPAVVSVRVADVAALEELVKSNLGKVVVVDVWSTSCEPCLKEFPGLVALHKKYGPDKLACISFSADYYGVGSPDDFRPDVEKFLREQGATFDNLLSSDASDAVFTKLEIAAPPAVFVFDQKGDAKLFDNSDAAKPPFTYAADVDPHVAKLLGET